MSQDEQLHDVFVDWDKAESVPAKNTSYKVINPWARFCARALDNIVFTLLLAVIMSFLFPAILELGGTVFYIFALFVWVFVESILLATWGTTLGKWLLKIKITTNQDTKPSLLNAFKRSTRVWFFGMAMGVPLVNIFTLISAYSALATNRTTSWDKQEQFSITHEVPNIYRTIIAWSIFAIYLALVIFTIISKAEERHGYSIKFSQGTMKRSESNY